MNNLIKRIKHSLLAEAGEASMMTVAMYMILFATTAVGFTYIVAQNYRRVTNTTLQNQAKEAANSGVEDAKRLLVKCYSSGDNAPKYCSLLKKPIGSQNCTSLLSSSNKNSLKNDLQIDTEDNGDGSFRTKVGDTSSNNAENLEYYQCLKISGMTKDLEYNINAQSSVIVPLKLNKRVTGLRIEWHNTSNSANGDGPVSGLDETRMGKSLHGACAGSFGVSGLDETRMGKSITLPTKTDWTSNGKNLPAILRVEVASYPKNRKFSINDLIDKDTAVTFRPYKIINDGSGGWIGGVSLAWSHASNQSQPNQIPGTLIKADCKPGTERQYSCGMLINYPDDPGADWSDQLYFSYDRVYALRISAIYRSTHVKISIDNSTNVNDDAYFDGVQPEVEVTGRSNDSYTRLRARLSPIFDSANNWYPEYAVDTNGKICKKMNVYYKNGEDFCSSY